MSSQDRQEKAQIIRLAHSARVSMVRTLKEGGSTNLEIAQLLGLSENTVRQILQPESDERG